MENIYNLINIGPTNTIQISNDTFDKNKKKILMSELGLKSKDRKSNGDKANISNP